MRFSWLEIQSMLLSTAILFSVIAVSPVRAEPFPGGRQEAISMVAAINKAGRQRMLVQRVAKEYLLIGLGAEPTTAQGHLENSVELFRSQLDELKAYARERTPGQMPLLQRIETLWRDYEAIALAPVSLEGARALVGLKDGELISRDEELLELCDRFAIELELNSDSPLAYYVNLASRQRMLTQRIAKYYMMISSGFDNDLVRASLSQAQLEFERALEVLEQKAETEGLRRDLDAAREQWAWLKSALTFQHKDLLSGKGTFFPVIIEATSDKTLLILDRLTHRFERLAESS